MQPFSKKIRNGGRQSEAGTQSSQQLGPVSVGIFIPPSVIKILLLHCILGVSSNQLHSIRVIDHLMAVAYYQFSLMVFIYWPIFIHSGHLQSFFVLTSAKVIFRVLGLSRSGVCHHSHVKAQ